MCNIIQVADAADVIVNGYAFTCKRYETDRIRLRKIFCKSNGDTTIENVGTLFEKIFSRVGVCSMEVKYYGCIGINGYNSVVKMVDASEAYIYNRLYKAFHRNDDYMKAMFDPGSEYDEITKEKAEEIIRSL